MTAAGSSDPLCDSSPVHSLTLDIDSSTHKHDDVHCVHVLDKYFRLDNGLLNVSLELLLDGRLCAQVQLHWDQLDTEMDLAVPAVASPALPH